MLTYQAAMQVVTLKTKLINIQTPKIGQTSNEIMMKDLSEMHGIIHDILYFYSLFPKI